jgi:hypothetical protein
MDSREPSAQAIAEVSKSGFHRRSAFHLSFYPGRTVPPWGKRRKRTGWLAHVSAKFTMTLRGMAILCKIAHTRMKSRRLYWAGAAWDDETTARLARQVVKSEQSRTALPWLVARSLHLGEQFLSLFQVL